MPNRYEIIARLRQLPEVLGLADSEIAEILGISASLWSNYKAEHTDVTIRPMVALTIWNAFGVPMEWIYDGQTALVSDPVMRAKLVAANRRAEAWVAERRSPPKRRTPHIVAAVIASTALFWAAPEVGHAWKRMDGLPTAAVNLEAARGMCMNQANKPGQIEALMAVYSVCMVDHGYVLEWYRPR